MCQMPDPLCAFVGQGAALTAAAWLVERLFESPTLLPIRRPNYFVHQ